MEDIIELNISQIVNEKLSQMDRDGVIKQKIEESLEKTVLDAISCELNSYRLQHQISEQFREQVGNVAGQLGLEAYNGFIAARVRDIVRNLYTDDFAERVQKALSDTMLKKHEHVKLSDIFKSYSEYVNRFVEREEALDRGHFTAALNVREDGPFKWISCRFAEEPDKEDSPDIELKFDVWKEQTHSNIKFLRLDGRDMDAVVRIGRLNDFECFAANLYFNETEVEMDIEAVETDTSYTAALED